MWYFTKTCCGSNDISVKRRLTLGLGLGSYCIVDIEFGRPLISIPDSVIFTLALLDFLNFNLILADSRYLFAI